MLIGLQIFGSSEGPSSIYLASSLDSGWFNFLGTIIMVLIMIPNILYALKEKTQKNLCTNMWMYILEQIGRYVCMFLMMFNIGILEYGFSSNMSLVTYLIGNSVFLIGYLVIWGFYLKKKELWNQLTLAILPTAIFILSGFSMRHYLLLLFGVIFGIAHIYITCKNRVKKPKKKLKTFE